ncbi:MAG: malectin domain-containing carbohydrate-binding protein [Bacteroidota bacterium]
MKSTLSIGIALALSFPSFSQNSPQAETLFTWNPKEENTFWDLALNCGKPQYLGGARVTFGIESHVRFPGTYSTMFYTNSAFEEVCNQNFSAERAEIHGNQRFQDLGVTLGSPGSTVWVGWSEMYTEIDRGFPTTIFQFLSGEGSPSVSINYYPEAGVVLSRSKYEVQPGVTIFSPEEFQENVWYDFIVEMKYSYGDDGYVKVWAYKSGEKSVDTYRYTDTPKALISGPTIHNGIDVVPFQTDVPQKDQGPPRLRWGVYRWRSADRKPIDIPESDWLMVKYLGPARMSVGDNLGAQGFESVKPRWTQAAVPNVPNELSFHTQINNLTRLNAGGKDISCFGGVYEADQPSYWFGNSREVHTTTYVDHHELYASARRGTTFGTNISVPSGSYTVSLHFNKQLANVSSSNRFNISCNGKLLTQLDLSQVANNQTVFDLAFQENVRDGLLNLFFESMEGEATLSGITLRRDSLSVAPLIPADLQVPGKEPGAIRINSGSPTPMIFGDIAFEPDTFFNSNSSLLDAVEVNIENTFWPELYRTQRTARDTLSYNIPVTPGVYAVRLHVANTVEDSQAPVLSIEQEGQTIWPRLSLLDDFGDLRAAVLQNSVFISDSTFNLKIFTRSGKPILAGIELIPQEYLSMENAVSGSIPIENPLLRTSSATNAAFTIINPEVSCSPEVYVWPNPVSDRVNLSISEPQSFQILTLEGKVLESINLEEGLHTVPVSHLATGIYLLRWENPDLGIHKLVVKHP